MTSTFSPAYPADYYYPQFLDNRPANVDPVPSPLPLSTAITSRPDGRLSTNRKKSPPNNIAFDIVTNQGLPEVDINQASKTDPKKNLIRDPAEKNMPKLIVDQTILRQANRAPVIPATNLDDVRTIDSKSVTNGHTPRNLSSRPTLAEPTRKPSQRSVKFADEVRPGDDYWKKDLRVDDQGVVVVEVSSNDECKQKLFFCIDLLANYT